MLRKFLLFVFSSFFLVFTLLGALILIFGSVLLDRDYFKAQLQQVGVYEGIPEAVSGGILAAQAEQIALESGLALSHLEVKKLVYAILPPAWIQSTVESLLDGTLDWLRSDSPELDIVISLSAQKRELSRQLEALFRAKGNTLPICTPIQLQQMGAPGRPNISCLPPGLAVDEFLGSDGIGFYETINHRIPEEIRLDALLRGELVPPPNTRLLAATRYHDLMTRFSAIRQGLWWYETGSRIWIVLETGFLLLMLLLLWRRPLVLLSWIGKTSLTLGLEFWLLRFGLTEGVSRLLEERFLQGQAIDADVLPWLERGLELVKNYLSRIGDQLGAVALPLFVVGVLSLGARAWLGRGEKGSNRTPEQVAKEATTRLQTTQANQRREQREIRPAPVRK